MTHRPHAELAARLRDIECSLLDEDVNATLREAADLLDPPTIKPTITLIVNGREWVLPEPFRGELEKWATYWIDTTGGVAKHTWWGDVFDEICFRDQRVHASESDAQAWADFNMWCRGGGA